MAKNGVEALGSMGDDAPIAVLSDQPQLALFLLPPALFAQVTNPPLDALREELVTASDVMMGSEGNILETVAENCHLIRIKNPILTNQQLAKVYHVCTNPASGRRNCRLLFPMQVKAGRGMEEGVRQALQCWQTSAIELGFNIFILSDRGVSSHEMAPIPAHCWQRQGCITISSARRHAPAARIIVESGRTARGASLLAADWLRRNRGQSLHGL
jgi:hypothetical protein